MKHVLNEEKSRHEDARVQIYAFSIAEGMEIVNDMYMAAQFAFVFFKVCLAD